MIQPSTISLERPTPRIATITFSNAPANLIVPETVIRLHTIVVDLNEDPPHPGPGLQERPARLLHQPL